MPAGVEYQVLYKLSDQRTIKAIERRAAAFAAAMEAGNGAKPLPGLCSEHGGAARDFEKHSCCGFAAANGDKDPIATIDDWALWLAHDIVVPSTRPPRKTRKPRRR